MFFEFLEEDQQLLEFGVVERAPAFYVRATQDLFRRWFGDPEVGEQREAMPGHRDAVWN